MKNNKQKNNMATIFTTLTRTHTQYTKSYRDLSGCVGVGSRSIA